jgi:hypothetical protein
MDYGQTMLTRRTNLRTLLGGSAAGALALLVRSAGTVGAQTPPPNVIPINISNALGSFVGTYTITQFVVQNGVLTAVGTLAGTVTNAAGAVLGTVNQTLTLPVTSAQASCEILHLELGPLDLNLLGLVVHLDRVVLDITAQPGAGNLLGNLLCAVANLLNNGGPLTGIAGLLNNILRHL